jgi:hypothetical protein
MINYRKVSNRLQLACLALILCACSAAVRQAPAAFTALPAEAPRPVITVSAPLSVQLDTNYRRSVASGSRWTRVGRIAQGEVYKPHQHVFTVEGAHVHEAYLVVDQDRLVGFYLPAERAFSPLSQQLSIHFNQEPQ